MHTKNSNTATYFFAPEIIINLLSVKYLSLSISLSISTFFFIIFFQTVSVLHIQVFCHKEALPDRQCTSFPATGCHFTGPVALRPRLSSGLPIIPIKACQADIRNPLRYLIRLNLYKSISFIILPRSTVHKKNLTALTLENKKEQPIHILELFS